MTKETIISGESSNRQVFIQSREMLARCRELPVSRKLFVKGLGSMVAADNFCVERPRGINDFILIFCEAGQGVLELGSDSWEVSDNQLILTRPGVPHVFKASPKSSWVFYWMHFSGENAAEYGDLLGLDEQEPVLYIGDQEKWISCFEQLYVAVSTAWTDMDIAMSSMCLSNLLVRTGDLRVEQNPKSRVSELRILESINYMTKHFSESLTTQGLARMAGLSVPQYSALFKKYAGTSPMRHLTQIRLRSACDQLKYSDAPVKEIAMSVGYDDALYFSRLFKKHLGGSPREFRRQLLI